MQDHKKRQNIRCWNCGRDFSLLMDTAGEPTLSLSCLYCNAPLTVNLAVHPRKVITVMKAVAEAKPQERVVYDLPDMLESAEPSSQQSNP